ncbi:MAG TPA: HAMP domain-containing sensor histidine kinase [Streptosporangiaceae bacterium]|nr:HAMP domain-containing sensor histidine kinase [Streptosporangiaceae bacterium]
MKNLRVSLRTRLTLIYAGLFLVTATLLVAVTYLFTTRAVETKFRVLVSKSVESGPTPGGVPAGPPPDIIELRRMVTRQAALQRQAILHDLLQSSALTVGALCLLAVVLGYLVAGRMLRPLQTVTATARRLSENTLHERIGLTGPRDEIKELADTFDGMLDRLHRAFDLQRRFIANASHELRTPLAINRAVIEVELAKPGTPDETRALGRKLLLATARHERLIEGLLLLARSERELSGRTSVDAAILAQDAIDQFGPAAQRSGVRVTAALSPAPTSGDVVLLERCVANLVENAITYNHWDGRVWVLTGEADGRAYVRVENTGPPVSPTDAEIIFEPFRRLTRDRAGSARDRVGSARGAGLGLSIVRAVVRAHGGTIAASPRRGGGLVITLRLPTPRAALTSAPALVAAAAARS